MSPFEADPGVSDASSRAEALPGVVVPAPPPFARWWVWLGVIVAGVAIALVLTDRSLLRFLLRLYQDRDFLHETLQHAGVLAPLIFIVVQALQVVIAPVPGEVTGFLGGYLFGEWLGFLYSTIGLTAGSLFAFWIGRRFGTPLVRRLVPDHMWDHMGFLIKAEGSLLCFTIFLIPGLPKDIACYLFGLSPIPFGVFATVSTVGRMAGTWALSAQGAKTATGEYLQLVILVVVIAAVGLPLYYYRHGIVARLHRHRD